MVNLMAVLPFMQVEIPVQYNTAMAQAAMV
jgi:hypothetical protein